MVEARVRLVLVGVRERGQPVHLQSTEGGEEVVAPELVRREVALDEVQPVHGQIVKIVVVVFPFANAGRILAVLVEDKIVA